MTAAVAEVELMHVPEPALLIKRFDRKFIDYGVERLHIIDGCQALGLSVGYKYERPYGNNPDVQHVRDEWLVVLSDCLGCRAAQRGHHETLAVLVRLYIAARQNFCFEHHAMGLRPGLGRILESKRE